MKAAGLLDSLPLENAKLDALLETIKEILAEDPKHKVAVFAYFKPMLAMIGAQLVKLKIPFTTLTGDMTSAKERYRRIDRFNDDPECKVFLSSDAGAYGVDLNQGSHLICYDLPWSAGALAQRVARIDRTAGPSGPDPDHLHVRAQHDRGAHVQHAPAEGQGGQSVHRRRVRHPQRRA